MASQELFRNCKLLEGAGLGELYRRVGKCCEVRGRDVARRVAGALYCKVLEAADALKSDGADGCLGEQRRLLGFMAGLLDEIASGGLSASRNYDGVEVSLHVVPVPLALTTKLQLGEGQRVVTFRLASAADALASILWLDMASRVLEALRRGSSVIAAVDLTHGINYASASLLRAGLSVADALSAVVQVVGSGTASFRFYNSDPVVKPAIEVRSREAYKIHLVASIEVDPDRAAEGFTESLLSRIPRQLGDLNAAKNAWREYAVLAGVHPGDDSFEAFVCSVTAASSGLPFWAAYFAGEVVEYMENSLGSNSAGRDPLSLFIETANRAREKLADFTLKPVRCGDFVSYNIEGIPAAVKSFSPLLTALMVVSAINRWAEEWRDCVEIEFSRGLNLQLGNARIHGLLAVKIRDKKCFDEFVVEKLRWVRLQSREIIHNEVIRDDRIEDEKVYGYMPGNIELRNLLAHAGLSRGAAILLHYKPKDGKKTLEHALLADTSDLRAKLRSLWK
jgi:hypothetical protein